jgi:hypothetical protein
MVEDVKRLEPEANYSPIFSAIHALLRTSLLRGAQWQLRVYPNILLCVLLLHENLSSYKRGDGGKL